MKIARGEDHDLQGVEDIGKERELDPRTLRERFDRTEYIGRRRDFQLNYCAAVGRLFGNKAEQAALREFGFIPPA